MKAPDQFDLSSRELGDRLQSARRGAGKTQEEAALALGVARTTVTAIEKGERRIQAGELVALAQFYGKSINELVRMGLASRPLAVQLRAAMSLENPDFTTLEPFFAEFQALSEDYFRLEELCHSPMPRRYPDEYELRGLDPEEVAEDVANQERDRLGLGDGPVHRLRDMLEREVGLRIFCMKLPSNISGMFIYDEVLGGCIAANVKHSAERIRQTIAHEWSHFLTSREQPSVEDEARYKRIPQSERFAFAFGPAFLMPSTGLRRRLNHIKSTNDGAVLNADLVSLADYYGVSLESLTRRLEALKLVRRGTWEKISHSKLRMNEVRALLGLERRAEENHLLPARYSILAIKAFDDGQLTEGQFARFLRTDILEARDIHVKIQQRTQSDSKGTQVDLPSKSNTSYEE